MDKRSALVFDPRASVSANAHDPTHPFAYRLEWFASAFWNTSGRGASPMRTIGSARAAAEVVVPTHTGGCNRRTDTKAMDMAGSGAMANYPTITVEV